MADIEDTDERRVGCRHPHPDGWMGKVYESIVKGGGVQGTRQSNGR